MSNVIDWSGFKTTTMKVIYYEQLKSDIFLKTVLEEIW